MTLRLAQVCYWLEGITGRLADRLISRHNRKRLSQGPRRMEGA